MLRCEVQGEAAAAGGGGEVTRRPCCATKIRKRCALSSSSGATSDPLRRLRLKRGVVVLRRTGGGGSPCPSRKMSESSWTRGRSSTKVSARKLVSALWQMNEGGLLLQEEEEEEEAGVRGSAAHRRCASSVEISKRSRTKNRVLDADGEWFSDKLSNGGTMGVHARGEDSSSMCSMGRDGSRTTHLQDMHKSLTASRELVRVLASIWGPGDLNPSTASLLAALRSELDLARAHARWLAKEEARRGEEAELLKRRLAAEARAWKGRQREKAAATARVVAEELDGERRSRRRAERVNCKLGEALAGAESSLRAAEKELQRERTSRERLEKVCEELVGAGPGEEVVRAAREELDKEREMLRLADELREERVQMKLLEARLQFEEKNAVVDRLRGELQAFLDATPKGRHHPGSADEKHLENGSRGAFDADPVADPGAVREDDDGEERGGNGDDDSEGSDMHSIELDVHGNRQECGWSYSTAASKEKAPSDRGTECAVDPWAAAFDRQSLGESEGGQLWDDEGCSVRTRDDVDEDSERYQAIKNLREQMLAGHGFVFLSQEDQSNADRHYDRYGLMCHDEEGKR